MMTVLFTCDECGQGIHVYPSTETPTIGCQNCHTQFNAKFTADHVEGRVCDCPKCERKDFYSQRDFNRKIGVILYLIPTAVCLFWGLIQGIIGFFLLWMLDFFLFRKLSVIAICYKCNTIFRNAKNIEDIPGFDHEMNDRIVYSDHDFKGKPLQH